MPVIDLGFGNPTSAFLEGSEASPSTDRRRIAQRAQDSNRVPSHSGLVRRDGAWLAAQHASDPFWYDEAIDPTRWDKSFPYQLLVLDVREEKDALGQRKTVYTHDGLWEFTLPIPPEGLDITTPFAITLGATQGGIVEEHNGAPFRHITIRGSTGVMPNRDTAANSLSETNARAFTGGIFGGTIGQISQVVGTAAQRLGFAQQNLMDQTALDIGLPGFSGRGTGYFQYHLLRMFMEGYVAMKKRPEGRKKRLALAIWKDRQVYIVSPTGALTLSRSVQSPLEYMYSLTLKAYRRVPIGIDAPAVAGLGTSLFDAGFMQNVLGALLNARNVLEGARDVMEASIADVDQLFEPMRQTTLLLKLGVGTAVTLADLPTAIAAEAASAGSQALSGAQAGLANAGRTVAGRMSQAQVDAHTSSTNRAQEPIAGESQGARQLQLATATAAMFANSKPEFETMSRIDMAKLQLRPATRRRVQEEQDRVRKLTRLDFETFRDTIQKFAAEYADSCGAGSTTYDETYNRNPKATTKTPAEFDWEVLFALNQTVIEMSRLALASPQATGRSHALDMVAGLARRSGIAMSTPRSKIAVPVPYHTTLEQLATQYLGDPNRWLEIATLNGLREPYIDEEGFDKPLITNGSGGEIFLEDADNLYVGQAVSLVSTGTPTARRRITSIRVIHSGLAIVRLDGELDLARFTTMGGAYLHAYLPDTINSQQLVFVPSAQGVAEVMTNKSIPGISPTDIARGGVDLLLRDDGDAAIGPGGRWPYAVGLTNLIQRVRIAFQTRRGTLPQHPSFGLGLRPGENTGDLDAKGVAAAARGMFAGDPDFAGISAVRVLKTGNAMKVNLDINVAGNDVPLPVSLDVQR